MYNNNMEKINIFVISHKPVNVKKYPGRKIIYVGKKHNQTPDFLTTFTDNTKDNISELNPYYCELTGLYWVWKNYKQSEYIGFEHYSRAFYFGFKKASTKHLYNKAKKCDFVHAIRGVHFPSSKHFWIRHEGEKYYPILKDTIAKVAPEYLDEWVKIMDKRSLAYLNMFVCNWDIFDKYMSFLFKILDEAFISVKKLLTPNEQARSIGYMAERLMDVFISHNNYKDKSCFFVVKKR